MVWQVIAQQNRYGNVTKSNKFYEKCLFSAEKEQFHNQKAEKEAHKSGISRQNAKKSA